MSIEIVLVAKPSKTIYGLWRKSNDRTIAKDIPALSKQYYTSVGKTPKSVVPFFVLSKDYDEKTGDFDLFIGGEIKCGKLTACELPGGQYGKVTVRPKLGFIWSLAIGEVKRYVYTKWVSSSEYLALNMEYEHHTQKSIGKKPEIDLFFALEKT